MTDINKIINRVVSGLREAANTLEAQGPAIVEAFNQGYVKRPAPAQTSKEKVDPTTEAEHIMRAEVSEWFGSNFSKRDLSSTYSAWSLATNRGLKETSLTAEQVRLVEAKLNRR